MLKTPSFWTQKNIASISLLPLSLLYFFGFELAKFFTRKKKISKPVICIGNINAGGAGKTPTAIAIGKILHEIGITFAFLSRGYMGDGSKFLMLRQVEKHKAEIVGDEPLLLLDRAPTFIAQDKLFGAQQIEQMNKFDMIVLDDGMQNNSLHRDFTIMVVDGKIGFGNGFLLPAGPMREPLRCGLKKADLIVVVGESNEKLLKKFPPEKLIKTKIVPKNLLYFSGKKLVAFCGLAYPEKFFSFLKESGLDVVENYGFPDHYNYNANELERLCKIAEEKNAMLVTTKKDWVKFPQFQDRIRHFDIDLEFENKELVRDTLKKLFCKKKH